jgi:hypothetical protein
MINQQGINSLIENSKRDLYICMPSIHEEVGEAILKLTSKTGVNKDAPSVHILIDYDAQTFRQGYGDHQTIETLREKGLDIKKLQNNRISFIISDEIGYYLFIESRSLIPADKQTVNAVKIDPVSLVRLKMYFFRACDTNDFEDDLTNAIIEESKQLKDAIKLVDERTAMVADIDSNVIIAVKEDLRNNPPLKPDFKRIVDFYSNKFQYVKLSFDGSGISNRKIDIPPEVFPLSDAGLKKCLETRLNLFDEDIKGDIFKELNEIKDNVRQIREYYLTKIKSRDESLLDKNKKANFKAKVELLRTRLSDVKKVIMKKMSEQIDKTKTSLLNELQIYYEGNPQTFMAKHANLWKNEPEYVRLEAYNKANELIHKLKWPKPHEMVEKFEFTVNYSDITYEDLKNEKFIAELKEKGLITSKDSEQLANFSKGVQISGF